MEDPTKYMVSNNPIASAFGEQDDEFFNSIGQENSHPSLQNLNSAQMYHDSDAVHQHDTQQSAYDHNGFGDQETYLPGQGPHMQQSHPMEKGTVNSSNPMFQGEEDVVPPAVEEPVPPPPTSFHNQQHVGGFESISAVRKQPGIIQNSFAPPPQAFGYGVAQEQEKRQVVEEEEGNEVASSSKDTIPKGRLNPSLEAGRRKLEEFKRKKAAVLSRRSSITSSQHADSGIRSDVLEARLDEAQDEVKKMKSEVQRLTEDLEASRDEKHAMEREKAALLGELVSLKASVEDSGSSNKAIELLREELDAMKDRTDGLEASLASSRGECHILAEEKAQLEEELNTLKVNSALKVREDGEVDRIKMELESLRAHHASIQSECAHLQSQLNDAVSQEQSAREELMESKENIDSLRELLSEGEQERVELASHLESLKAELTQMQQQQQPVVAHDDAGVLAAKDDEIRILKEQLIQAEKSATEWREKAAQQQASCQPPDSSPLSPSENALQVRLAKAEAAVESERRAFQDLQQKTKDMENAMFENATLKSQMTEMRQKEEYLEQQIHTLQAQVHDRPVGGGDQAAMVAELQQRASTAENKAQGLEMELSEASNTITRLSGEVNDLINRLKEQSSTIVELRQKAEVFESVPINDDAPPPIDQSQHTPHVPPQYQQSEEIQQAPSLFDSYTPVPPPQEPHQPWSIPGGVAEAEHQYENTPDSGMSKKKVGFWQWVAGADLASHQ